VLTRLQKIPIAGESFDYDGRRFTVVEMDGHRISKVRIEMLQERPQAVGRTGD
jgi:CBS domain containing-hemolysin-like protein